MPFETKETPNKKYYHKILSKKGEHVTVRFIYKPNENETYSSLFIEFDGDISPSSSFPSATKKGSEATPMQYDSTEGYWHYDQTVLSTTRVAFTFFHMTGKDTCENKIYIHDPQTQSPIDAVFELPKAKKYKWLEESSNVPKGHIECYAYKNKELRKIKPASALLQGERRIHIYFPNSFKLSNSSTLDFLVMLDGVDFDTLMKYPTTLDNLISSGKIAPRIAAFIEPLNNDRENEYTCNDDFAKELALGIVPCLRKAFPQITKRASNTTIAGQSLSGLQATLTALKYPNVFGNVLSQSGSFWYLPDELNQSSISPFLGAMWLAKTFIDTSKKQNVRFYLEAGKGEGLSEDNTPSLLENNRILKKILANYGFNVTYHEFNGGHHSIHWRGTVSKGLRKLEQMKTPQPKVDTLSSSNINEHRKKGNIT